MGLRMLLAALAAAVALPLLSTCSYSRTEYEPETVTSDPDIQRVLVQLEGAINRKDERGVCALYAAPAPRCAAIWNRRLRAWRVPVELSLDRITGGCAGDARVSFHERTNLGARRRTLTVTTLSDGSADYAIIDIAVGNRVSSLVIPRYGNCANPDGSASAPNLDDAGSGGQGNNR